MITLDLNPPGTLARLHIGAGRGDATYRDINQRGAARLAAATDLRGLRIEAPVMPRQRQLLGLLQHLPALREAMARIARVAVLSDSPPSEYLPVLRDWFDGCEVRHFAAAASRAADHWLDNAGDAEKPAPPAAAVAPVARPETTAETLVSSELPPDPVQPDEGVIVLDDTDSALDDDIDDWFVKS